MGGSLLVQRSRQNGLEVPCVYIPQRRLMYINSAGFYYSCLAEIIRSKIDRKIVPISKSAE